jgi:hypothetical protein
MSQDRLTKIVRYALAVAAQADERNDRELGPIHLLKIAYLADLAHATRRSGTTFTNVPWRFYDLGPWDEGAHAAIEAAADGSGAIKRSFDWGGKREGIRWSISERDLCEELLRVGDELPSEVASTIQSVVRKYGADTYELLDHVYLTQPMLRAAPGERLDFAAVAPPPEADSGEGLETAEVTASAISKAEAKRRRAVWNDKREALRERVRAGSAPRRRLVAPPTPAVYDDVFAAGLATLDEMAGPPIPDVRGTVTFSPEIWKSRGRRESDIS